MDKVLFAASEVYPLIKTGGLADVASSLPRAVKNQQCDIRIVMPAYRAAMNQALPGKQICRWRSSFNGEILTIWEHKLLQGPVKVWLIRHPLFDRDGGPYVDAKGDPWPDNSLRFTLLCYAVADIALGQANLAWQPGLVHCNDWQTGLVPALLKNASIATVFTIHNLAYQGLFDRDTFNALRLPEALWSEDAMEFYGQISFIKGGLVFADMLNTVSPNYAREICTSEFGCGLDHLLKQRQSRLVGILNGLDNKQWNPRTDSLISKNYGLTTLRDKAVNKAALQRQFGLAEDAETALIGNIGRLAEQKGIDWLLDILPQWVNQPVQFIVLGSGDHKIEQQLRQLQSRYPAILAIHIGYDEALAHQIEAGADIFLMPSRFEPCGLNQLYSLRYGTLPVVRRVGGLADTVIDLAAGANQATGFVFDAADAIALDRALHRATQTFTDKSLWCKLVGNAMRKNFSWKFSAIQYISLYQQALQHAQHRQSENADDRHAQ